MARPRRIRNNDAKSETTIREQGWTVIRHRGMPYMTTARVVEPAKRFVAVKLFHEDDDSVTHRYESAYTIEALAKQVVRREREEAR